MTTAQIAITRDDLRQLNDLLAEIGDSPTRDSGHIEYLRREIGRAKVVAASRRGRGIVSLNSSVLLEDLDTREQFTLEIVLPRHADADAGKISVLAPVATAILGCKTGDIIEQDVPGGKRTLCIRACEPASDPSVYAAVS